MNLLILIEIWFLFVFTYLSVHAKILFEHNNNNLHPICSIALFMMKN